MKKIFLFLFLFLFSCSQETETQIQNSQQKPVETRKIVALWDSLTAGYGVDVEENYPTKLQKKLQENGYTYEVINAWISWDTSDGLLSRAELYLEQKPEIAILVIGGNDGLRGLSTMNLEENILEIIDMYEQAWVKVVLWGMDVPINLGLAYRNDFKKVYQEVAEKRDKVAFFEFFLKWVAGKRDLNIDDMIHPNPAWYDIIVGNLYEFLEKEKVIVK